MILNWLNVTFSAVNDFLRGEPEVDGLYFLGDLLGEDSIFQ